MKEIDKEKYYIFKVGVFYLLLEEDAKLFSDLLNLKLTNLNDSVKKCGFPIVSKEKYFKLIEDLGAPYEVIEDVSSNALLINKIKNLDIENINKEEAHLILCELHRMLVEND